jgi:hypothetical protein
VAHPDVGSEQAYLDHAYDCLDRMREALMRAGDSVVDDVAGEALDAWNARRLQTFEDAEQGLCFGRIDVETITDPTYVGRRWVHDEGGEPVVVNWQAPAARPFYTATPAEPHGVTLRRRFRTQGRRCSTSATRRWMARSPTRSSRWTTSSWRSSNAPGRRGCATSSRRSRPTSTG